MSSSYSSFYSLSNTNEILDEKCEDLRKQLEELNRQLEIERRKNERLVLEQQRTKKEESQKLVTAQSTESSQNADSTIQSSKDHDVNAFLQAI